MHLVFTLLNVGLIASTALGEKSCKFGHLEFNTQLVSPNKAVKDDYFGYAVSVSDNALAIGAPGIDTPSTNGGAGFVYSLPLSSSDPDNTVSGDGSTNGNIGQTAIAHDLVAVFGSPLSDVRGSNAGAIFGALRNALDDNWIDRFHVYAENDRANDEFGSSFATGTYNGVPVVAVGSPYDDDAGTNTGAIYIYEAAYVDDYLTFAAPPTKIVNPVKEVDGFGSVIEMNAEGTMLFVGAPLRDDSGKNSGAVLIYKRVDGYKWELDVTLQPPKDKPSNFLFGSTLQTDGDYLVVGVPGYKSSKGAVFVFQWSDFLDLWIHFSTLFPDFLNKGDKFGSVVAFDNSRRIVVGVPNHDEGGKNKGIVALYNFVDGVPVLLETLQPDDGATGDQFGYSVDISTNYLVISSPYKKVDGASAAGAVYVYDWRSNCITFPTLQPTASPEVSECTILLENSLMVLNHPIEVASESDPITSAELDNVVGGAPSYSIIFSFFVWELSKSELELFTFRGEADKFVRISLDNNKLVVSGSDLPTSSFSLGNYVHTSMKVKVNISRTTMGIVGKSKFSSGFGVGKSIAPASSHTFPLGAKLYVAESDAPATAAQLRNLYVTSDEGRDFDCFPYFTIE